MVGVTRFVGGERWLRAAGLRATAELRGGRPFDPTVPDAPRTPSWVLHDTLLELLRRLNQAAERDEEIPELEFAEIQRAMHRFWATHAGEVDVAFALQLLLENGLAESEAKPVFAWDRQRVLGERFRITTLGKDYLHRQTEDTGRIR